MKNKPTNPLPRRQRRAPFLLKDSPTYFLTFCTANKAKSLVDNDLFIRACRFIEKGNLETGFFVAAIMIMPDHIHALVSISPHSKQKIGDWVRAFKRTIGRNDIRWQNGFFDHILRNNESRSEKWKYIRNDPVRAGLVQHPEQWPYQQWFHPVTGDAYAPDGDVQPTTPDEDVQPTTPDEDVRPTEQGRLFAGRTSLSGEKDDLRKIIAERKKQFFHSLETMSTAVLENVQTLEIFQQAKSIGAYLPLPDEVDVSPLFPPSPRLRRTSLCLEKQFYIPAFDESIDGYRLAKYTPELKKGKFGIPEPEHPVWAGPAELDLILVPGIAFDPAGNRLGRGGGFYDRLLPRYQAARIGICFAFQWLEQIPAEEHDIRMDGLVTDHKILHFATNNRQPPLSDIR